MFELKGKKIILIMFLYKNKRHKEKNYKQGVKKTSQNKEEDDFYYYFCSDIAAEQGTVNYFFFQATDMAFGIF